MTNHEIAIRRGPAAPEPPDSRRIGRWPWLSVAAALFGAGFLALMVDVPLAQWMLDDKCPRFLAEILKYSETFAHGIGIAAILITVYVLDVPRRWALPRLFIMVVTSGMMANLIKLIVWRNRPRVFDFDGDILASFHGWLPVLSGGSNGQSTPSAHTAATVALMVGLVWLYPRGRIWFGALAVLAAAQRIETGAHFLSDVFWGAALGWFVGVGYLKWRRAGGWLARWEERQAYGAAGGSGDGATAAEVPDRPGDSFAA